MSKGKKSSIRITGTALAVAGLIAAAGLSPVYQVSFGKLEFLDVFVVPYNLQIDGTQVGGLSGIDYDPSTETYYVISDDRSALQPARYYKVKISISASAIDTVIFQAKVNLADANGKPYPPIKVDPKQTIDPEGLRFNHTNREIVWVSEGERIPSGPDALMIDPSINITEKGRYRGQFPTPESARMQALEVGGRQNGTFEGLTFMDNYSSLLVSLEEPLYQDGPQADVIDTKSFVRMYKYDVATRKCTIQYAYDLEPVAYAPILPSAFRVNGVTDILEAGSNQILVVERSFSTGRLPCTVKIFLADLNNASDVTSIESLKKDPTVKVISKRLLLDMDKLGRHVDNVEGVAWGPILPNGHRTLILVTDNNFQSFQKTQFFLFEVIQN